MNGRGAVQNVEAPAFDGRQADSKRVNAALSETQRLAGIGTLTAGVAHELVNPISVITATCHSLLNQVADESLSANELRQYIERIDHSAWRCARLVTTLRTYSHIDSPLVEKCDLNEIIASSLTLVGYQFERQFNVSIVTDLARNLEPVFCDRNQITQVLINLLTNARDATVGHRGTIRISTWSLPDGVPGIEEPAVAFSVGDTGAGVDPAILDRIFDPFFTTKPIGEGSGLGLAITADIVGRHRGKLSAENHPEGGAVFTVVLPRHRPG